LRLYFGITSTSGQSILSYLTIDNPSTISSNTHSSDDLNLPHIGSKLRINTPKRKYLNIRPLYTNTYEGTSQIITAWEDTLISCYLNPPIKGFLPEYQFIPDTEKMFKDKVVAAGKL